MTPAPVPHRPAGRTAVIPVVLAAGAALAAAGLAGCAKKQADAASVVQTAPAARQTIVVDVEATGQITPINAVDVRSQASGQITALLVQTGSAVKQGDVLARIDPRISAAAFNQANAAVTAAQAQVQITRTQYVRDTTLLRQGVLTATDVESARLAYANAQSALVASQSQLQNARIGIENVVIRAPSAGVVIARPVSLGQVIASSTSSPSGGTDLMTLADLGAVYDSTLVNESDIGRVKSGQEARVTVDAYPGRTFRGVVQKVEPQATVQQSVTFFPVLIRIDNPDRALMPGMNTDVSVLVSERDNVLAVPLDAVRSGREAATAASALGLDADSVRALLQAQRGRGAGGVGADTPGSVRVAAGGASGGPGAGAQGAGGAGRRARGGTGAGGGGQGGSGSASGGGRGGQGGAGGQGGGGGALTPGSHAVVFVKQTAQQKPTFTPRVVTIGLSNYDYAEVTNGLQEGEQVALVSAAVLQQQRTQQQDQIRSRTALPGIGGGSNTRSGSGSGGSGGGSRGGGGPPP
ncbi:hypothetical protein tb265_18760 [Gemmatimonadetes bacterium T265]|nr:hypothetical protein tb265_18760 [Gemmatimonadetes bacterium T265]